LEGRGLERVYVAFACDSPLPALSCRESTGHDLGVLVPSPFRRERVRVRDVGLPQPLPRNNTRRDAAFWRTQPTAAEALLWSRLRNRQIGGPKFRRQHPIGAFVMDFYCSEHRLAVEVDGGQHFEPGAIAKDGQRTARLELLGIQMLRFTNLEVLTEMDGVLERIFDAVSQHPSP